MRSRLIATLLALTVILQATIIYLDWSRRPRLTPSVPQAIEDTANIILDTRGLSALGNENAQLVVVEFSDYECPFCKRHRMDTFPVLEREWISTGRVRYLFANNPLSIHPSARMLASAAICAGKQDRFWDMHNMLFAEQPRTEEDLLDRAQSLRLDDGKFSACFAADEELSRRLNEDIEKAESLGLTSTPAFAVGKRESEDTVRIQKLIRGAQTAKTFTDAIKDLMK